MHDKNKKTAERVDYIETRNLLTNNPAQAARIMARTAKLSTRCKKPVYHMIVSWHEHDSQALNRHAQLEQINRLLEAVSLHHHQAVIAFHSDTDHPHAHIIINRINPQTHKAAPLKNDYKKLRLTAKDIEWHYGLIRSGDRKWKAKNSKPVVFEMR